MDGNVNDDSVLKVNNSRAGMHNLVLIYYLLLRVILQLGNRPFPSCFEPHYESEAKCKVFVMFPFICKQN